MIYLAILLAVVALVANVYLLVQAVRLRHEIDANRKTTRANYERAEEIVRELRKELLKKIEKLGPATEQPAKPAAPAVPAAPAKEPGAGLPPATGGRVILGGGKIDG